MLHLLNGDATAAVFPDELPGERAVWRDILMEGPASGDAEARAQWLAPRLGITAETYARRFREGEATLARAREHDEVVLWFERDLFCATNLWFVLARLDAPRVSLVFPEVNQDVRGLGTLAAEQFPMLFEDRYPLSADEIAEARRVWQAYAGPDPTALARLEPAFPFALGAVRMHVGRFPSVAHGLDEVEYETLAFLERPLDFAALFRRVTEVHDEMGLGDVQFAATLRDLTAGATPLVRIEAAAEPFGRWRVSRTDAAADVLAGRADRLALVPLERWLGGVHLRPGAPGWRWDGRTLVAA
ncbi:MAG TPA: hypothetical protein VGT02_05555 [Methylomirabilota bacterium]|jgi:hypothetical protein|nr:hypothetical protein [Methylomirabilota bacterium]